MKTALSFLLTFLISLFNFTSTVSDTEFSQDYSASNDSVFESFSDCSPCTNQINAIIFMIDFQDVKYNPEYSEDYEGENVLTSTELEQVVFGDEDVTSIYYPYESMSAYYKRSSYGALDLSGIVLPYTTINNRCYYDSTTNDDGDSSVGYEELVMEVMDYYDDEIDFTTYDSNKDGLLDNIYFSVPLNGEDSDSTWWGNQSTWATNMDYCVDGEYISKYVILDGQPFSQNIAYYNQICIHETGHLMGLPDYYDTKVTDDDFEGFDGMAGYDMMDEMSGDHNAFSKIMLGWINRNDVEIVDTSSYNQEYTLTPIESTKQVLLIPINQWNGNFCDEYYLLEYDIGINNNSSAALEYGSYLSDEATITDLEERDSGIRIWHVNALLTEDSWKKECDMFAYDSNTTDSTEHMLELINNPEYEEDGFYRTGDQIALPDGPTITLGNLEDEKYSLSITYDTLN